MDTSTYVFTNSQLVDIVRFTGYPAMGNQMTGFTLWHYFSQFGQLQFRMMNYTNSDAVPILNFLAALTTLENNWLNVGADPEAFDTLKVGTYELNLDEDRMRETAYNRKRIAFCNYLGIPPGPGLSTPGTATCIA